MAWKHSSGSNGAANTLLILTTTWIASERRGEAERRGAGLKLLTTSQKLVRVCRPTPDAHSRLASGPLPFRFYPLRTGSEERSKFPQVPQPQMCRNGVWNAGPSPKGHVIFRMWYCSSPEERDIREGKRKVDLMHLSCSKKKKKKKCHLQKTVFNGSLTWIKTFLRIQSREILFIYLQLQGNKSNSDSVVYWKF